MQKNMPRHARFGVHHHHELSMLLRQRCPHGRQCSIQGLVGLVASAIGGAIIVILGAPIDLPCVAKRLHISIPSKC